MGSDIVPNLSRQIQLIKHVLLILCVFCFAYPCLANDDVDNTYSIIYEDFEEFFPPLGWKLVRTNQNHTWEKVESAANGEILAWGENYFAYVHGPKNEFYDESLITSKIINGFDENCFVEFELVCEPGFSLEMDFNLAIDISANYDVSDNPTWKTLSSLKMIDAASLIDCDPVTGGNHLWRGNDTLTFNEEEFWIRFRYTGTSGTGVGLDHVYVTCNYNHATHNGGSNSDDDDDETPEKNSDDKKEDDCNCGLSFHDPAAPLALIMILIGCGALLISRRR